MLLHHLQLPRNVSVIAHWFDTMRMLVTLTYDIYLAGMKYSRYAITVCLPILRSAE